LHLFVTDFNKKSESKNNLKTASNEKLLGATSEKRFFLEERENMVQNYLFKKMIFITVNKRKIDSEFS